MPPRGVLFFCNFSFEQAKEKLIQKQKSLNNPIEGMQKNFGGK